MIETITTYRTSDGRLFGDYDAAVLHEQACAQRSALEAFFFAHMGDNLLGATEVASICVSYVDDLNAAIAASI